MEFSRYARSYLTRETVRFTLQIENFSAHALKGYYLGPKFRSGASGSRWSLVTHINDGFDYGNLIDVRLKRERYRIERQYVHAKLSIVDCFGKNVFSEDRDISFGGDEDRRVLSVAVERVREYFGLSKLRYLPNDSLLLRCELVVSWDNVLRFDRERDYERSLVESDSVGGGQFTELFVHSRMMRERFSFVRRIDEFLAHISCGAYACPDYHCRITNSNWTLTIWANDDGRRGDSIDVRLKSSANCQLAKVKLSVVGPRREVLASNEEEIYFTASKEARVLSLKRSNFFKWFGFPDRLLPGDAVTLICEVDLLNDTNDRFLREEEFNESLLVHGGYERKLFSLWHVTNFAVLLAVSACLIHACYSVLSIVCVALWGYVTYLLHIVAKFCGAVALFFLLFRDITRRGKKILWRRSKKHVQQHKKSDLVMGKKNFRKPQQWLLVD